jgi:putative transposase
MSYSKTILAQIIDQVSRLHFSNTVKDNDANKYVKKLTAWKLFIMLVFAHLSEAKSMRHLQLIFNSASSKHYHLGCDEMKLNTFSNALAKRPSNVFREIFFDILERIPRKQRKIGRNFKKMVSIVDATCIPFKGVGSDWAKAGKSRQEARAHVLFDASGMPLDMVVTGASVHETRAIKKMNLAGTEVLVMDRGYCGFKFWNDLTEAGIIFVTRAKKNLVYKVVSNRRGRKSKGVLQDQEIRVNINSKLNKYSKLRLRRIVFITDRGKFTFITNDLNSPADVICELYRIRWDIETFFKWIKQNLKIKKFFGRSRNAVECQLWVALIIFLLLYIMATSSSFKTSILKLLRLISANLLSNINLCELANPPNKTRYKMPIQPDLFNSLGQ